MSKSNNDNKQEQVKELQDKSKEAVIDNRVTLINLAKINPK